MIRHTHADIRHSALRLILARELLSLRMVARGLGKKNSDEWICAIAIGEETALRRVQALIDNGTVPELRVR